MQQLSEIKKYYSVLYATYTAVSLLACHRANYYTMLARVPYAILSYEVQNERPPEGAVDKRMSKGNEYSGKQ